MIIAITFTTVFLKYLLVPLVMLISVFIFSIINKGKKVLRKKRLIVFALLTAIFIAVPIVFMCLMEINFYPVGLIVTHLYFFFFGFALVQFTYTDLFESIGFKDSVVAFVCTIVFSTILGSWLYYIIFDYLSELDYVFYIVFGSIWILMPMLLKWAEDFFVEIPPKIYKLWYPENNIDNSSWETIDLRRLKEATIRIRKHNKDELYSSVDAKIPESVTIGNWFNRFIEDHDVKFPDTPIALREESGDFYGWVFYKKRFIPILNTPIDFEKNPEELKLKDKATIIAKRVVDLEKANLDYSENGNHKNYELEYN